MWDPDNVFLHGPYAPWHEQGQAFVLEVEGQLPDELSGALHRVCSSQFYRPENPSRYHRFEGDGMVRGSLLREGRATCGGFMNGRGTPLPPGKFPKNPDNTISEPDCPTSTATTRRHAKPATGSPTAWHSTTTSRARR